jgi:uncharacterized protein (TIGR02118 family)
VAAPVTLTARRVATGGYGANMIKLTVSYAAGDDVTFDHDYYAATHVPMCNEAFKPVRTEIERGVDGPAVAAVSFYFDSAEDMQAAMASERMGDIMGDIVNYTNATPSMQISNVVG